jgi:hypothetical protein
LRFTGEYVTAIPAPVARAAFMRDRGGDGRIGIAQ